MPWEPLYIAGKRDNARRYTNEKGKVISRRDYMVRSGESPEEKAFRRYQEGRTATPNKTAQKVLKRKAILPTRTMRKGLDKRGKYQLVGTYEFVKVDRDSGEMVEESIVTATGFSKTVESRKGSYFKRGKTYYELQGDTETPGTSICNAVAQLEGYEWEFYAIIEEHWLSW